MCNIKQIGSCPQICLITPPTIHTARAPYGNHLRTICGVGAASARSLEADGETVIEFTNARYGVTPGRRFGFEVTPVRIEDGVSGKPIWVDCIRR